VKADEHRELPGEGLAERLDETRQEYFNLRFQNATGQLENFGQLGQSRREIARILTVMRERELGIEVEVKQPQPKKKWRKPRPVLEEADEASSAEDESDEEPDAGSTEASPAVVRASASSGEEPDGDKEAPDG
jgi:large subunit ribosomal protein L29